MEEIIKNIITDILSMLYQSFWFSLFLAVLFMFVIKQHTGFKDAATKWMTWFKTEKKFRRTFFLVLYSALVMFRTLMNRSVYINPLSNVLGEWTIFESRDAYHRFNPNVIENVFLLIPFIFLLFLSVKDKLFKNGITILRVLTKSAVISFLVSFTIETLQLFLHLGTWQLSDLVYNTLGGIIGGVLYYIAYIIVRKHRNKVKSNSQED